MPLLTWSDLFSVGVKEIDRQHMKLLGIANRLNDAMQSEQEQIVLAKILGDLVAYTQTHFSYEERLMEKYAYPQSIQHRGEHQKLVQMVIEFQRKFDCGDVVLTSDIMAFLRDWLSKHIMTSDKAFGKALNGMGVR